MSTFPQHVENINALNELGFDVEDCFEEDGSVTMDSWSYDDQVYIISDIIKNVRLIIKENEELNSIVNAYEYYKSSVDTAQHKTHNSRIEDADELLQEELQRIREKK